MFTQHCSWRSLIVIAAVLGLLLVGLPLAAQNEEPPVVSRQDLIFKESFWSGDLPIAPEVAAAKSKISSPQPLAVAADWVYLVYQSYRDGNWEIYLAHDGQGFRLTTNAASDARPRLNRGATKVAFNSNRDGNYEIYTMNIDGSNVQRLTFNAASDSAPTWSPDGTKIAFMSNRDGNYEIYLMNADGSGQTRFTYSPSTSDVTPAWSPDGSQIAWVNAQGTYGLICVMNVDGSGYHPVGGSQPYLADAQWSSDGNRFAFDLIADPDYNPFSRIYWLNADGSGFGGINGGDWLVDYWVGSWIPNSLSITYTRVEYVIQNNQIYIGAAYIESNEPTAWTSAPPRYTSSGLDLNPDWQLADIQPPHSQVNALPSYSRAAGTAISWSGGDSGVAGIASYDIQYRLGVAGAWGDWQPNTANTMATYVGSAGQTVYFRSRARDRAGNVEAWPLPDTFDAFTILYELQFTGLASDIRDHPIPGLSPSILPTPINAPTSTANGLYTAYTSRSGIHQVVGSKEGYGGLPTMTLNITANTTIGHYLPPLDNQISNGDFESGGALTGWATGGNVPPTIVTSTYSGRGAAFLGAAKYPTLGMTEVITGGTGTDPKIAVDQDGLVHIVYHQADGILYSQRDNSGNWSIPTKLDDGDFAPAIAVTPEGNVHVVWSDGSNILYRNLPPGGTWSTTTQIVMGTDVDIVADALGEIHIAYQYTQAPYTIPFSYHMMRVISGSWTSPVLIIPGEQPRIAVDPQNQIHAIVNHVGSPGTLRYCEPSGQYWSCGLEFNGVNDGRIRVDQQGIVHVFITKNDLTSYYAWKRTLDPTFTTTQLPDHNGFGDMVVDNSGTVYLVNSDAEGTYFRYKPLGQTWLPTAVVDPTPNSRPVGSVDLTGRVHLAYEAGPVINHYQASLLLPAASIASVSQTVMIPPELHHPTLSLLYQIDRYGLEDSTGFTLSLSDEITSTTLLSETTNHATWAHSWIDLEPWSGQLVTLTMRAIATQAFDHNFVTLDDVSLGSWLTPIITDVVPNQLQAHASAVITITGDNFILTPTVRLNEILIADVTFIDEHTLQVGVTDNLSPGRYDVWVANPGGQESALPRWLLVGHQVLLPVARR